MSKRIEAFKSKAAAKKVHLYGANNKKLRQALTALADELQTVTGRQSISLSMLNDAYVAIKQQNKFDEDILATAMFHLGSIIEEPLDIPKDSFRENDDEPNAPDIAGLDQFRL
ncbi:MAG: hypothetical protein AB8B83_05815 [Bdellovibrionales bacterium]